MSLATPGCVQELQTASHASLIYPGGVCLFREPDAVTPPVRFDEREQETELGQTGLRRAKRKPSPTATGRLRPLRLFSTLPNNLLVRRLKRKPLLRHRCKLPRMRA